MKRIASLITGLSILLPIAASAAPLTVLQYEAKTSLSERWERDQANRDLIAQRVRSNQTNRLTGETNEDAVASNLTEIQNYSDAYLCASKKDVKRCLTSSAAKRATK